VVTIVEIFLEDIWLTCVALFAARRIDLDLKRASPDKVHERLTFVSIIVTTWLTVSGGVVILNHKFTIWLCKYICELANEDSNQLVRKLVSCAFECVFVYIHRKSKNLLSALFE